MTFNYLDIAVFFNWQHRAGELAVVRCIGESQGFLSQKFGLNASQDAIVEG